MQNNYRIIMLILLVVIVISFFLPWISVESAAVGEVTKVLTGKRQATLDSISAFKVPILANSKESRFMISVIKIFNPGIKNADKKSFLIWLIPGLALVIFVIGWVFYKNKWVNLIFGIIGCLIFFIAVYKIITTDLDKLVLRVNVARGVWLTLLGYLGIGTLGLLNFIKLIGKKTN